jgi:hypothetical protein
LLFERALAHVCVARFFAVAHARHLAEPGSEFKSTNVGRMLVSPKSSYMRHVFLFFGVVAFTKLSTADCVLKNIYLVGTWPVANGEIGTGSVRDSLSDQTVPMGLDQVQLLFEDGQTKTIASLVRIASPSIVRLEPEMGASRKSEQLPGSALEARFEDPAHRFTVVWKAELRQGSRYIRIGLRVTNSSMRELPLAGVRMFDLTLPNAASIGDFTGSPIVAGMTFLGIEHPLARNNIVDGRMLCVLPNLSPLKSGETFEVQAVVGFADPGQMRRAFASYLERERAHPYRPFLHHNTWYNIGYRNPFTQADLLAVIQKIDLELVRKRGVKLDAFVLDDGWDDPKTLWDFNPGFPQGLKMVSERAEQAGAGIGIWLSPWGGYGEAKELRVAAGTRAGYETRDGSFSLAGPRYFKRFQSICTDVLEHEAVVYFKFDGIGSSRGPDAVDPSAGRDFEAMLRLIAGLRKISPNVFINQTTGTWPSPFWLLKVDSIWRGGEDHDFAGVGSDRERWITYRDAQTYRNVVRRSPLFPLNSLMVHGIIYAAHAEGLSTDRGADFANEVHTYFGSGTQLQELYLSPELLTPQDWDVLAEAARWSRSNASTLCDTHWIGGDPAELKIYGWAAWSPQKGIITLRNPADRPAKFLIDAKKLFELPPNAPRSYVISSPFPETGVPLERLRADDPVSIELPPFGVVVLEAIP